MRREVELPAQYGAIVAELKDQVRAAQRVAQRSVNTQLVELYWSIGRAIRETSQLQGWGSRVIGQLADDLRAEFPQMRGFSARNLQYMATFAGAWVDGPITQQPVARLPWGHVTVLLDKLEHALLHKFTHAHHPRNTHGHHPRNTQPKADSADLTRDGNQLDHRTRAPARRFLSVSTVTFNHRPRRGGELGLGRAWLDR